MRATLLSVFLSLAALAQTPAPPPAIEAAPPRPEPARGGGYLISAEVIAGVVTGSILGGSYGSDAGSTREGIYFGSLAGGVLLGAAAAVYQHFVPVHRAEAVLAGLGGLAGSLAGFGLGVSLNLQPGPGVPWAVALGTQVGMFVPLLLTAGGGSVSAGDVWTVTMGMVYATIIATVASTLAPSGTLDGVFISFAPSLGFGIGAAFAAITEAAPGRVLAIAGPPLGVGLTVYYLAALASKNNLQVAAISGLIGLGGTLGTSLLIALLSGEDSRPAPARSAPPPAVLPTPMLLSSNGVLVPALGIRGEL
jgi:hypothetical protein